MMKNNYWLNGIANSVSVYDVARAHIMALENPIKSKNKRYIMVENSNELKDFKNLLFNEFYD